MMRRKKAAWCPQSGSPTFRCALPACEGSVSFRGKLSKGKADDYQKLYQSTEIRSRSAATRCT